MVWIWLYTGVAWVYFGDSRNLPQILGCKRHGVVPPCRTSDEPGWPILVSRVTILMPLTFRKVYRLVLRHAVGLSGSIIHLFGAPSAVQREARHRTEIWRTAETFDWQPVPAAHAKVGHRGVGPAPTRLPGVLAGVHGIAPTTHARSNPMPLDPVPCMLARAKPLNRGALQDQ